MIKINIIRKKIKHMYLKINANGDIYLSVPLGTNQSDIEFFIKEKEAWITKQLHNYSFRLQNSKLLFNDSVYYLGIRYKLNHQEGVERLIIKNEITIQSNNDYQKTFYKLVKSEFNKQIQSLLFKYQVILNDYHYYNVPLIKTKNMKGRWGVCYPGRNEIYLNIKLIHFTIEQIEAVLWHEILHLIIPNHSKRFHEVLEYHMPNYKELVKGLY